MSVKFDQINIPALLKLIVVFFGTAILLTTLGLAIIWLFSGFPGGQSTSIISIQGQVIDTYTQQPVPAVEIRLIMDEASLIQHTDSKGYFTLEAKETKPPGTNQLNYYHPDYRPELVLLNVQPDDNGVISLKQISLVPLVGEPKQNQELLNQISALRKVYDFNRASLIQELRELLLSEATDPETQRLRIILSEELNKLDSQRRFLIQDSLAYELREIDQITMRQNLEEWRIEKRKILSN